MIFGFLSRKQRIQPDAPSTVNDNDSAILHPPSSESPPPSCSPPSPPPPPPVIDPSSLYSLIRSVPPQIFHSYSLDRLHDSPSSDVLTALSSFFSSLVPPPRLHCVRCHKSYFEVENTDRSCLIPHDDESAEVERVPLSTGKAKGLASEFETHWSCCGRTVEGDGDMGPPDGWCYEGKHTTDIKRARFRADSTSNDDKLVPCSRLRCPGQLLSPSPSSAPSHTRRAAIKRARPVEDETEAEDPVSQTDVEKDRHSPKRRRTKSTASRRKSGASTSAAATETKASEEKDEKKPGAMDVDPPTSNSSSPRPKPKHSRRRVKSAAFVDDENDSSTSTPSKPQSRKTKSSSTAVAASTSSPPSSSPAQQGQALLNSKSVVDSTTITTITPMTKTISILESQLNNSVGSLSELSSIKSSSPGCGTKFVQRVAYVEVKKSKQPLRVEETILVEEGGEYDRGDKDKETDKEDKETDKENEETDKEDKRGGKGKDKEEAKRVEAPRTVKSMMKTRSSPRRPFNLMKSDLGTGTIKSPRGRTKTRTRPLNEVVDTSVDTEKMGQV